MNKDNLINQLNEKENLKKLSFEVLTENEFLHSFSDSNRVVGFSKNENELVVYTSIAPDKSYSELVKEFPSVKFFIQKYGEWGITTEENISLLEKFEQSVKNKNTFENKDTRKAKRSYKPL